MRNVRFVSAILCVYAIVFMGELAPAQEPKAVIPVLKAIDSSYAAGGGVFDTLLQALTDPSGGMLNWHSRHPGHMISGSIRFLRQMGIDSDPMAPRYSKRTCPCCDVDSLRKQDSMLLLDSALAGVMPCCVMCGGASFSSFSAHGNKSDPKGIDPGLGPVVEATISCPAKGWLVATGLCDIGFEDLQDSTSQVELTIGSQPGVLKEVDMIGRFHGPIVRSPNGDEDSSTVRYVYAIRSQFWVGEPDSALTVGLEVGLDPSGAPKTIYSGLLDLTFLPDYIAVPPWSPSD